ncbi:hypothetical protein [Aminivibrio sp.]|uniref:hypothetical protein n=1 Tax=Aminivibrio sp. TaxID=1872489 RepID=UPI00345E2533
MSLRRLTGMACLTGGAALLAWMAFEYFFLAFLAGKLLPEAGFLGLACGVRPGASLPAGSGGPFSCSGGVFPYHPGTKGRRKKGFMSLSAALCTIIAGLAV